MSNGASSNDVAVAALSLVETYLRNPNVNVSPEQVVGFIRQVHDTAMNLGHGFVPGSLDAPFAVPQIAGPATAGVPVPAAQPPVPAERHGRIPDGRIWPGVPRELRQKFMNLIEVHNLQQGPDGVPLPRRPRHLLISPDTMTVADPFTGEYFAMLKRRLHVHYGLSYKDMLDMFHLTDEELPKAGPGFSASKRRAAIENGLGHYRDKQDAAEGDASIAA